MDNYNNTGNNRTSSDKPQTNQISYIEQIAQGEKLLPQNQNIDIIKKGQIDNPIGTNSEDKKTSQKFFIVSLILLFLIAVFLSYILYEKLTESKFVSNESGNKEEISVSNVLVPSVTDSVNIENYINNLGVVISGDEIENIEYDIKNTKFDYLEEKLAGLKTKVNKD